MIAYIFNVMGKKNMDPQKKRFRKHGPCRPVLAHGPHVWHTWLFICIYLHRCVYIYIYLHTVILNQLPGAELPVFFVFFSELRTCYWFVLLFSNRLALIIPRNWTVILNILGQLFFWKTSVVNSIKCLISVNPGKCCPSSKGEKEMIKKKKKFMTSSMFNHVKLRRLWLLRERMT